MTGKALGEALNRLHEGDLVKALEGRTVYVIASGRYANGKKWTLEDEHHVRTFRCLIEPDEPGNPRRNRNGNLVQFFAREGGLRTTRLRDIVLIS